MKIGQRVTLVISLLALHPLLIACGAQGSPLPSEPPLTTTPKSAQFIPATPSSLPSPGTTVPVQPTAAQNTTSTNPVIVTDPQTDSLIRFIVNQLSEGRKKDFYVVRVDPVSGNPTAPLKTSQDFVRQCWFIQNANQSACTADAMLTAFRQESAPTWKYSYLAFAITNINSERTRATVRLDEVTGPLASTSFLITFMRVDNQWREESRQTIRTS